MAARLHGTSRQGHSCAGPGNAIEGGHGLLKLEKDPEKGSKRLTQPALGTYRFRIGDYRVIFDVHGADVVILRVGHRSSIYR